MRFRILPAMPFAVVEKLRPILRFDNAVQILASRTLFRGTRLGVHRIAGAEMIVDHSADDAGSIRHCLDDSDYRRFVKTMGLRRASVLDVGANVGGFPLLLSAQGVTLERILCVEMNPNTYDRLRFNIRHNFPASEVVHAAIVGTPRQLSLELGRGSTGDSVYRKTPQAIVGRYTVDGITLDAVAEKIPGPIDVLKLDIEGAEAEVLTEGPPPVMLSRVRWLVIEIHPRDRYGAIVDCIERAGLKLVDQDAQDRCGLRLFGRSAAT
jgi:FkbM family methyltransferase